MTINEIYTRAMQAKCEWLIVLIEFLVFEKGVICFGDKAHVLDLYFKPNNEKRMNQLLLAYRKKLNV